jgi:autoinducer 2-binding protein LuxP
MFFSPPSPQVWAQGLSAYWTLEAFMEAHPEQKEKMTAFSRRVQEAAIPIPDKDGPASPLRIAIVYPGFEVSDYWQRSVRAFQMRLEELRIPHTLHILFRQGSQPEISREDMDQIREILHRDPDYLVYTLTTPEHYKIVERLLALPRPKILLQNITTPLRRWDGYHPFLYVGFDHMEGTRLLAEEARSTPGPYVVLNPHPGYLSEVRGDIFIRLVSGHGPELRDVFHTGIDRRRARLATLDALARHPDLIRIYAATTDIALGAADALVEKGLQKHILLNGWGGGESELQALRQGLLSLTVMRMNDDSAVAMAEAIGLDARGLGSQVPRIYSGDMVLVNAAMSEETIAAMARRAFRYSGLPGDRP